MTEILKFNPDVLGDVGKLMRRLVLLPRATRYYVLCRRIGDVAVDLPVPDPQDLGRLPERRLRQCDHLAIGRVVEDWVLAAARIDVPAAMVILDAMDAVAGWLDMLGEQSGPERFLVSNFKREFTQIIAGTPFVFRIPGGWELSLNHQQYDEGNYGVGEVVRCHLSESTTHDNWAWGDLVGKGRSHYTDLGYFGVPCRIASSFKRIPIDADDERWHMSSTTGTIPFQWITHTLIWNDSEKKCRLQAVPNDDGIVAVARQAIEVIRARQQEIARRMLEAQAVRSEAPS